MPTLDGLISRVRRQLLGYTLTQDVMAVLAEPMTASSTTLTVAGDARNLGRGLMEIDDELLLVRRVDQASGSVSVLGGQHGRGREGTEATAHAAGSLVTVAPAFPRTHIRDALAEATRALYPDLVVFDSVEIARVSVVYEYELPADVDDIWYVVGETLGPDKVWRPLPSWRYNPSASPSAFSSGKSIQLLDEITPGRKYRIVYAKRPQVLASGTDDWSVTGYPDSVSEVALWGACARLAPAIEAGRLQQRAVEASNRAEVVQPQSAIRTAAYYQALQAEALLREKRRQWAEHPQYQSIQG